jgi:sortase A
VPGGEQGGGGGRAGRFAIPATGFKPGAYTRLGDQPASASYADVGVTLRIPKLKLNMSVQGVPYVDAVWQVDWLTGVGGWLQGTAFPGLSGNSVIMSHVVTRYGAAGPFARLNALNLGDNIYVTSLGRTYVYQVKKTGNVAADDISVLKHATKPVLRLITCSQWNEATQTYDGRYVVYAELVQ